MFFKKGPYLLYSFSFLCTNIKHVVATDKRVTKFVFKFSVDVLFRLFQGDIHVTVYAGHYT